MVFFIKKILHLLFLLVLASLLVFVYFSYQHKGNLSLLSKIPSELSVPSAQKFVTLLNKKTPCNSTLYYSFGNIDTRHNIIKEKLVLITKQVEKIWEEPSGYNLFEYQENAPFKINFIFDERQQQTNSSLLLDQKLKLLTHSQADLSNEYTTLLNKYNASLKKYNSSLAKLNEKTLAYNEKISYWNKQKNISEEELKKLEDEKNNLQDLEKKVNKRRKKVNSLIKDMNQLAEKKQSLSNKYTQEVFTYKNKYGVAKQFSQGEYFGDGINIYQFQDQLDLTLALTHEFGHALGIGHTQNPASIMYYLMEYQDLNNLHLTAEDLAALKAVCE